MACVDPLGSAQFSLDSVLILAGFSSLESGMCRSNILVQKSSHRAGLSVEKGAERCIDTATD